MKAPVWILYCLHWLIWTVSLSEAIDINCCPHGTTWLAGRNCTGGHQIRLTCPNGFYKLQGDIEKFKIRGKDDKTVLVEGDYPPIKYDDFCLLSNGTNQSAFVCFDELSEDPPLWHTVLFVVLSLISAIFLIITLGVYLILPELRDIQDKAMMSAVFSLAISYTILCIQNIKEHGHEDVTICIGLAFLLYYAFISAFCWLNVVAFNIWRTVWFKNFKITDKILFPIYCIHGWFVPACFLISVLSTHYIQGSHIKPNFGEYRCWFAGMTSVWAFFYGPIAVMLLLNIICLSLTSWRLWHEYREYNGSKLRALRFKCLLYIKLMFVMGITWIFELLSSAVGGEQLYWIATDALNSLQGLIIFLLLVVMRKRVRKLLAKKKPCGIAFPKSWTAYEDEECEVVIPEELELSQQAIQNRTLFVQATR